MSMLKWPGVLISSLDALSPVFDLTIRFWVASDFFRSGLVKIQSWESTLALFEYEYTVPLLAPGLAAWLAAGVELVVPVLLVVGPGTRLGAAVLFVLNIIAATSYPEISAAGVKDHLLWGLMLAMIVFHGPGKYALDHLIRRHCQGR